MTARGSANRYTSGDELPTIVTRFHDEPWCSWIRVDDECRCDLCREELEVRETDGHMSSPRQVMVWGTVITIDGLDIDLEREQVQTWGIFCDRCAQDLREQAARRAPAALAYRATHAIPVTDATVNLRARALEAIGELEVRLAPIPTENHRLVTTGALEELISAAIRFGACSDSEMLRFEQVLNRARAKVGLLAGGPDR